MEAGSLHKSSSVKKFLKGQTIILEGDTASDRMYIVLQGSAASYRNYKMLNEIQTALLEPGGFFGEMGLFLGRKRPVTVVARSDVIVLEISKRNVIDFFVTQPQITFSIIEGLCRRLDSPQGALFEDNGAAPSDSGLAVSGSSPIFPEGHGNYILPIDNSLMDYLLEDTVKCPMCGHSFKNISVLESKLVQESKDDDMRIRYRDVEPMYYEVISCPSCLYSAMGDLFRDIEVTRRMVDALGGALAPYKDEVSINSGVGRDTFSVFAGYYLAILSAPVCFYEHQRITARLWRNLSRIYDDCSDSEMMLYALRKSLEEY
ncbi:MAG: DUF2225 domain-containing protein, partial [Clostridiales Family XIII bacterium]|nr:DUF2225 domain-containing protein [Clostridiales Family XIII bacterium]